MVLVTIHGDEHAIRYWVEVHMWRPMGRAIVVAMITVGAVIAVPAHAESETDEPSILFVSDRDGNKDVFVIDGSDGGTTNLTKHPGSDTSPTWSPDGSRIAFISDRGGNRDIWIMDADGSNAMNMTTSPDEEIDAVWSPDGMRIAYSAALEVEHPDGSYETVIERSIFVFDLRMGDRIRLTIPDPTLPENRGVAHGAVDRQPGWSPDGSEIVFERHYQLAGGPNRTSILFIVAAEGEGTPEYLVDAGGDVAGLDWAPNGEWIIWSSRSSYGVNAELRRVYLHNGFDEAVQVPLGVSHYVQPSVSTDNATVLFVAYNVNRTPLDIYSMDLEGNDEVRRLTDTPATDTDPVAQGWYPPVGLVDTSTGRWMLRDGGLVEEFFYGNPGDFPFVGDWNCDGVDTPGLYRQADGFVYLRNTNTQGNADVSFFFGDPGDVPLSGDFNGDGCDTVSIY
ncbi:MAG: TolB family protein, partial [Acidimicrobiia bacterium]